MESKLPRSFLPPRFQVLSGSALKMLAVITMLIDHLGAHVVRQIPSLASYRIFSFTLYQMCRDIGRIAFPIYVFLLVEGAMHTRNRFRYGRNLLLFAFISEIPWNLIHGNNIRCSSQNVYFTLFLGYLGICCIEYFHDRQVIQLLSLFFLLAFSFRFNADYGWRGFLFILIMYWFRYEKVPQAIAGCCWLSYEWKAGFAFLPINMYNGQRGFIRGKLKYIFYWFYPVHIMILYYIKYHIL